MQYRFLANLRKVSVSTSFTETLQHMRGLGVIFHHRGVEAFSSTVSRHLFCEYRAFNVSTFRFNSLKN